METEERMSLLAEIIYQREINIYLMSALEEVTRDESTRNV